MITAPAISRLLFVDDDHASRWTISRLLQGAFGDKVQVDEAGTGRVAICRIRDDKKREIQTVFTDLCMPNSQVDGMAVVEEAFRAKIPNVILSTGMPWDLLPQATRQKISDLRLNGLRFFPKPYSMQAMEEVVIRPHLLN